jgi:hypothetical protein
MDDMSTTTIKIQLPRIRILPRMKVMKRRFEQAIAARTATRTRITRSSTKLDTLDLALFVTYFCTVVTSCFMFVTLPSIAAEYVTHPEAVTAFVAGVASTAPLGGGVGKLVNGFVCERLGGKQSSCIYLVGLGFLSLFLSNAKSAASIGLLLAGCEFLTSIQWTSAISILDVHYHKQPAKMAQGIALISTASAGGAMLAKTGGATLMKLSSWRTVVQCGAGVAFLGALCMMLGVSSQTKKLQHDEGEPTFVISPCQTGTVLVVVSDEGKEPQPQVSTTSNTGKSKSLASCLKAMFSNPIFWMIGLANTVGYVARSDSMLSAFLVSTTALPSKYPRIVWYLAFYWHLAFFTHVSIILFYSILTTTTAHICAALTSSVSAGFVLGLKKGRTFSQLETVPEKVVMLQRNYRTAFLATIGLALCGVESLTLGIPSTVLAGIISLCAALVASSVSFQFYQLPSLVTRTLFSDSAAVSLSMLDAVGFFVTAQVLAANRLVLGRFGWSAAWGFLAVLFGLGGKLMLQVIPSILQQAAANKQHLLLLEQEQQLVLPQQ